MFADPLYTIFTCIVEKKNPEPKFKKEMKEQKISAEFGNEKWVCVMREKIEAGKMNESEKTVNEKGGQQKNTVKVPYSYVSYNCEKNMSETLLFPL